MAFTIPTIFSVIDKFSAPMEKMQSKIRGFTNSVEKNIGSAFGKVNKLLGGFGVLLGGAGVVSLINGGIGILKDYDSSIANLQAITGSTNQEMAVFKARIKDVAGETKKSMIEVSDAFAVVGNAQPELLKSADALSLVTKSSIVLAQASKMELAPAAGALTSIMNQFGLGAKDAQKSIDLLAAGSVIGSSEITDTAAAIQKAGAAASISGIKLNEMVTAIEAISGKIKGEEAGTQLKNMFLIMGSIKTQDPKALKDMHRLGVNMDTVQSKAVPLIDKLKELSKIKGDAGAIQHLFGKENAVTAITLLNSVEQYSGMLDTLTNSEAAQNAALKMAAINTNTLEGAIYQLKAGIINLLISTDDNSRALNIMKASLRFVHDHLTKIIGIIATVIAGYVILKGIMIASTIVQWTYVAVQAVSLALQGKTLLFLKGNTAAMVAYKLIMGAVTIAQWLWNAAMAANPIGLIIIGIAALIAGIILVIKYWDQWGAIVAVFLGPFGLIISMIESFRRNWDMIANSFKNGGILEGFKAIGKTILDAILYPLQRVFELLSKIPYVGSKFASAAGKIEAMRTEMGTNNNSETINPSASRQQSLAKEITNTNNSKVNVNFANSPYGMKAASNNPGVSINIGSTMEGAF